MNNCDCGEYNFALAPNGKIYVCPAYYYEDENQSIGDLGKCYDSKIDNISGGELLKIAIARVLIRNPSILLLDEITSDLDGKSEQKIISLLNRLSENKTIILISHRLTSIINISNIYVLNKGNVIGQGSHEQLIESCSLYKSLANSQGKIRGDAYDVC